jgi:two-component sensor histidine kinase
LRGDGKVVTLKEDANGLHLCVSDNGNGISEAACSGLGTTLIEALAVDLAGEVSVESCGKGTSVHVRFPIDALLRVMPLRQASFWRQVSSLFDD